MNRNKEAWLLRFALLLAGAGMMIYGVSRGEVPVVFNKAVNVCLECIGLG